MKYRIIESRPATYYWGYTVEANNENEALEKILTGDIESNEAWCEESEGEDSDYEIYSDENK